LAHRYRGSDAPTVADRYLGVRPARLIQLAH